MQYVKQFGKLCFFANSLNWVSPALFWAMSCMARHWRMCIMKAFSHFLYNAVDGHTDPGHNQSVITMFAYRVFMIISIAFLLYFK